jgi:hypothetical protein
MAARDRAEPTAGRAAAARTRTPRGRRNAAASVLRIAVVLVAVAHGAGACLGGDWPQWRGPGRSGAAVASPTVVDSLPVQGLAPLWTRESEEPMVSSPVVVGDRLVTFGGSRKGGVRCYRLAAAGPELVWKNQELSDAGSSPGVGEGLVFVQSGGSLVCLGLDDGAERWRLPIAAPSARSDHPATRRLP